MNEKMYKLWCSIPTVGNVDEDVIAFGIAVRRAALEHCADVVTNVIAHGGDMNAALGLIRALAASDSNG